MRPNTNTRVIKGRGTRRQLLAPRSSAAVAESTEKNVTGTSNRAVTCQYMSGYRVRFQPRRLGERETQDGTHRNTAIRLGGVHRVPPADQAWVVRKWLDANTRRLYSFSGK